jgi:hypothetical protein
MDSKQGGLAGEVNAAFKADESDPPEQDWPSFKEKLARFNSRFANAGGVKTAQASEHAAAKEASPAAERKTGVTASPSLSAASIVSLPSSAGHSTKKIMRPVPSFLNHTDDAY